VRVNSNIPEPSRGWAEVNGSSIGKITAIEGPEGQEEVTVDFPECKDWVGLATELEMSREPIKGEKVQVTFNTRYCYYYYLASVYIFHSSYDPNNSIKI